MKNVKTILLEIGIISLYIIIFLQIWPSFLDDAVVRYQLTPIMVWSVCNNFFFGVIIAILIHGIKKIRINFNIKYFFLFVFFQAFAIASMGYLNILITIFPTTSKYVTSACEILTGIYFIRSFIKLN